MAWRYEASLVTVFLFACGPATGSGDSSSEDTQGAADTGRGDDDDDDDDDDDAPADSTGSGVAGSDDGASSGDTSGGGTSSDETTGDDDDDDDDDDATETGGAAGLCSDDGQFGLTVTGSDLQAYDGMLVWAAAVEPMGVGPKVDHVVVVSIEATIADGAFELSCAAGLEENTNYPSLVAVIDADDSGTCSDGDVGVLMQYFGWLEAQTLSVEAAGLVSVVDMNPFDGTSACEYFF